MADISKITPPGSQTTYNLKDATAREQANWNTNNGVKNLATENNFSNTGYYKDVPVDGSLTGNVVVYIGNITSTDTDANQCAVLFMYTDDTSSPIHLANRGTSSSFSANLETKVLKCIRIYSSDNYVHSSGDTVTVTNLMVCPKALYDADSTYEPYSLSNTKITPELIELVDSGAKNLLPVNSGTATPRYQIDVTLPAGEYMLYVGGLTSTDTDSSTCQIIAMTAPSGTVISPYVMATRESGKYYNFTLTDTCNVIYVYASDSYAHSSGDTVTFSNLMICSKAAWDISQKYVPYRPTYEETVEQVAENKNNILLKQDKTWIKLKTVTTTSDTFELDLRGKSEFKIVLIHNTDIYEASAPVDLIAAGYKLIVSHINSATPSTDIGTFVYNFSAQGTDDFTATIPSTSYNLLIFAR